MKMKVRKWVLPAAIVVFGLASTEHHPTVVSNSAKAVVVGSGAAGQSSEPKASTVAPQISVNGITLPTDKNGISSMAIPGGKAEVSVSDGHTAVSAHSNIGGASTSRTSENLNVRVDSQSGDGTNSSFTQVSSSNVSSTNSGVSSSSTSIFSAGATHVSISQ